MKTTEELNALIPEIADALANNHHDIGDLFPERNYFCFEKDGWYVWKNSVKLSPGRPNKLPPGKSFKLPPSRSIKLTP